MIKALVASLALSTLCIPQVNASSYTENDLLDSFKDLGGRVYIDSELCKEYKGAYGLQQGATVHLCTEPHAGDTAEYQDTIRHEIWHIVQLCHGGPVSGEGSAASMISAAYGKGWTEQGYKPDTWHMEAEAHFVAATRSAEQISNALIKSCS